MAGVRLWQMQTRPSGTTEHDHSVLHRRRFVVREYQSDSTLKRPLPSVTRIFHLTREGSKTHEPTKPNKPARLRWLHISRSATRFRQAYLGVGAFPRPPYWQWRRRTPSASSSRASEEHVEGSDTMRWGPCSLCAPSGTFRNSVLTLAHSSDKVLDLTELQGIGWVIPGEGGLLS